MKNLKNSPQLNKRGERLFKSLKKHMPELYALCELVGFLERLRSTPMPKETKQKIAKYLRSELEKYKTANATPK